MEHNTKTYPFSAGLPVFIMQHSSFTLSFSFPRQHIRLLQESATAVCVAYVHGFVQSSTVLENWSAVFQARIASGRWHLWPQSWKIWDLHNNGQPVIGRRGIWKANGQQRQLLYKMFLTWNHWQTWFRLVPPAPCRRSYGPLTRIAYAFCTRNEDKNFLSLGTLR